MQSGSEDPEVANVLQKCEEYVPGKVHRIMMVVILKHFDELNLFPHGKVRGE